jgi:hypothetical protein
MSDNYWVEFLTNIIKVKIPKQSEESNEEH